MAIVTYLPRMLPMTLIKDLELSPFIKRSLNFMPYTILSALIFPEILSATDSTGSAIFGGLVAIILAWFKINLFIIISSSIAAVLFFQLLI